MPTIQTTIVCLHGFQSNGPEFKSKMEAVFSPSVKALTKRIYLQAPSIPISCYENATYHSWHDYYTNYGDKNVNLEEEIGDLRHSRQRILDVIRNVPLNKKVILLGESQGACMAIDVAMNCKRPIYTVASYGQRYACTRMNREQPFFLYASRGDTVIPSNLLDASMANANVIDRQLGRGAHSELTTDFVHFIDRALGYILKLK